MAFAKFEGNRFRIDGEIAENHAILVNLTASIYTLPFIFCVVDAGLTNDTSSRFFYYKPMRDFTVITGR